MDDHTLELLEFDKLRTLIAARAACSLGKDAALALGPSVDPGEIHHRLALTTEMVEALGAGLRPSFGGLRDVRLLVRRARVGGTLEAGEVADVGGSLRAIVEIDRWLARVGEQFPRLGGLRQEVGEFSGLVVAIDGCLDARGNVLDTASRRLSELRREIGQAEARIQETLRQMLRSPELRRALRFPKFSMVGHHYVVPVSKEHRGEVAGAVLRTSASNETVYVEPAAIGEASAHLSLLRARETKEVRRILRWLSAQIGLVSDSLLATLETMAEIDRLYAQGRLSLDYRMVAPRWNDEGRLVLRAARHPLLEALFRNDPAMAPARPAPSATPSATETETAGPGATLDPTAPLENVSPAIASPPPFSPPPPKTVTPIDVDLGDRFHILVVTGPNTGGKTVALKTVGLLAIMAQCGLHVPAAEGSEFPVFDDVLADIGDEQSLEQSLSTFSSHIQRIRDVLRKATRDSLVLLDEMGAGTDPADGAALGRAILDELNAIGSRSIVTTHIGDLKTYALTSTGAENAAVEFDDETLQPRYRLRIGDIGQSNALKIARHLRLPEHVIARAEAYRERPEGEAALEREALERARKEAEAARQAAIDARIEAEQTREELARRLAELQDESRRAEALAEHRTRLKPGDGVIVPRLGHDRPGHIVKLDPRKKTAVVAIGKVTWNVAIDELVPRALAQGPGAPPSLGTPSQASARKPAIGARFELEDFDEGR